MRNRRVFSAQQLGLSPTIWGLELAYYGLSIEEDKMKEKKRTRPIDVVEALQKKKTASADAQREKIETVLLWMLSFYPKQNKFSFLNFDRTLHTKPEGMPEAVFMMDREYIHSFEKEWKDICIDNKVHFKVQYGSGEIFKTAPPAVLITSFVQAGFVYGAQITIHCFGDI